LQQGSKQDVQLDLSYSTLRASQSWLLALPRPLAACPAPAGFERSIRDVVSVVHIGEHTLSKRLYEFSSTTASAYTAGARQQAVGRGLYLLMCLFEGRLLLLKAGHAALLPPLACLAVRIPFRTR
jgi:hypothetical protein